MYFILITLLGGLYGSIVKYVGKEGACNGIIIGILLGLIYTGYVCNWRSEMIFYFSLPLVLLSAVLFKHSVPSKSAGFGDFILLILAYSISVTAACVVILSPIILALAIGDTLSAFTNMHEHIGTVVALLPNNVVQVEWVSGIDVTAPTSSFRVYVLPDAHIRVFNPYSYIGGILKDHPNQVYLVPGYNNYVVGAPVYDFARKL